MRAVIAVCGLLMSAGLAASDPAHASPTADDARTRLNALYARAAESARQFEAAQSRLVTADAAVRRERRAALETKAELAEQSADVAAFTIQQLQSQSMVERYSTMLSGNGPREYLERAAAYTSTAEAMNAKIDELSARKAVHEAERRRLEEALERRQSAMASEASARNAINAAIAESKRQTRLAAQEFEDVRPSEPRGEEPSSGVPAPNPTTEPAPTAAPTTPPPVAPPTTPPSPTPVPPPSVPPSSSEPYGVWDKIAQCESGGNWHINTGNGYYGGLQFSYRTWRSVGGPGYPHEQSREVQIHYAKILQARSGWGQWSCSWARFS